MNQRVTGWVWSAATAAGVGLAGAASGAAVEVGVTAPAFDLEDLMQAPAGESPTWASLRGQTVVLEFWATWCGPCVASIPHLNELAETFEGEPVRFIAITNEDRETVRDFLEDRPIRGWIGLDSDHSMFEAFGASSIPHTVLVDPQGVVRAVTSARSLTAASIREVMAGRTPDLPNKLESPMHLVNAMEVTADGPAPLQRAIIRPKPSRFKGSRQNPNDGSKTLFGHTPPQLIQELFGVTPVRMDLRVQLPDQQFEADFKFPGRPDLRDQAAQLCVLAAFGLDVRREARLMDALIVRALPDFADKTTIYDQGGVSGSFFAGDDEDEGISQIGGAANHAKLVETFEALTGQPVVNETLDQAYAVPRLEWPIGDLEAMRRVLRERMGLDLVPAKREIEVLVFTAHEPG